MFDGIPDLAVLAAAVLPGALYTWAFEREAAAWGARLTDRLFRFIGYSAIFGSLTALPMYLVWKRIFHHVTPDASGVPRARNLLADGGPVPWWFWSSRSPTSLSPC